MAQRTPPSWLQNGSHPAENDRLTQQAIVGNANGIIGPSSYAVTAQGSPNMTVNIAPGYATLIGATSSTQGTYVATNDATVVQTISPADNTYPRIDIIYLQVNDSAYSGTTNSVTLSYLAGTASSSPFAPAPTGSATYYILAQINVAAGVTGIINSNITDLRTPVLTPLTQSNIQYYQNQANPTVSSGGSVFGTNRPYLLAGHNYQIKVNLIFLKTTAGIITWGFNTSNTASLYGSFTLNDNNGSNLAGYALNNTTMNTSAASASYANGSYYTLQATGVINPITSGRLQFNAAAISAGTITPQYGSQIQVTDLGTATSIGNIG